MSASPVPSDDELRSFLLGTLSAERVEVVRDWLSADPSHAARLDRLPVRDPLTDALSERQKADPAPPGTIERVVRAASDALRHAPASAGDTPEFANHEGTVQQARVQVVEPVWPPARLGEYRVVREIGRGGMGVVLEVADGKLGRSVAAKVLNPELAKRPDATTRFCCAKPAPRRPSNTRTWCPSFNIGDEAGRTVHRHAALEG